MIENGHFSIYFYSYEQNVIIFPNNIHLVNHAQNNVKDMNPRPRGVGATPPDGFSATAQNAL